MPTNKQTKNRISITILPALDQMLEKISKQSGASKSSLIEKAICQFLEKRLDEDTKSLAKLHFDDLPSEEEWLSIQSTPLNNPL